MDYSNCIIIYSKNHLNDEFKQIIEVFNYVPKKYNQKFNVSRIDFNYQDKNILLFIDPNDLTKKNYKKGTEYGSASWGDPKKELEGMDDTENPFNNIISKNEYFTKRFIIKNIKRGIS